MPRWSSQDWYTGNERDLNVTGKDVGGVRDNEWSWFLEQQNIDRGRRENDERFGPEGSSDEFQYLDIAHEFWNQHQLSDTQVDTYETWYIDDLFDTSNRVWHGRDPSASDIDQRIGTEDVQVHWGTDLVRVAYDREQPTDTNRRHFEWLTRGQVDWAYYKKSQVYRNAWNDMTSDGDYTTQSGEHTRDQGDWGHFWDRDSDVDRISFIREVNRRIASGELDEEGVGENDDDFWTTWDNMYTSTYLHQSHVGTEQLVGGTMTTVTQDMVGTARDPSTAYNYEPTSLFTAASMEERVTARLNAMETQAATHPAITEQPLTPTPVTTRPDINIQTVNIERPANIPAAWGEV